MLIGGILVISFFVANSMTGNVVKNIDCNGKYIEYEGNCCLDTNYNNQCDVMDNQNNQIEEYKTDVQCGGFRNCEPIGWVRGGIYGLEERTIVSSTCNAGYCYMQVKNVECSSNSDCREGKMCANWKCS